jgi:hypothetical protein
MRSKSDIASWFEVDPYTDGEILDRLRCLQIRGALHGKAGYYPDGDYSSDADWCYGPGAEIRTLEERLDIEDGQVFDLYQDAHTSFLATFHPGDC